jgi:Iap family predicted aminopeptidase
MTDRMTQLAELVDADRLMSTTAAIAQWERLSGSEGEQKAFDVIESELTSLGFRCERHHPVCLVSLPGTASLFIEGEDEPIRCITHSFSPSTPPNGVLLDLAYAGSGTPSEYLKADVAGKAVLIEGLATPNTVGPSESFGAAAVIHNSGDQIHEMTISPVWGSPTPNTMSLLPKIPHISVDNDGARRLREKMESGSCRVSITASVDTGWKPLPVLIADAPGFDDRLRHVLLSGHFDSWYFGAMDNASANASMLEVARILSNSNEELAHGLRLAFWSGHSHARYATSTWYADEYWSFIHHHCIAHVNIDSPGGIGATDLSGASTMAETYQMAKDIFGITASAELNYDRIGRLGDQSFWGTGIPSFYCSISQQPPEPTPTGVGALLGRGGGLGWWWHTADDTLDKLDPEYLRRDASILLSTVYQLCATRKINFDQASAAREIRETLEDLQASGGESLDLTHVINLARNLEEVCHQLQRLPVDDSSDEDILALYNGCVTGVSRILIPVNYTVSGEFEHDPAIPGEPLPGLQPVRQLQERRKIPDAYFPWLTRLKRERNRVEQALIQATNLVAQTSSILMMDDPE